MFVDIYRTQARSDLLYLFVEHGVDPGARREDLGPFVYVKTRDILPGQRLIGCSAEQIISNVTQYGSHLQGVNVTTGITQGGATLGGGALGSVFGPIGALVGGALGFALGKYTTLEDAKRVENELL